MITNKKMFGLAIVLAIIVLAVIVVYAQEEPPAPPPPPEMGVEFDGEAPMPPPPPPEFDEMIPTETPMKSVNESDTQNQSIASLQSDSRSSGQIQTTIIRPQRTSRVNEQTRSSTQNEKSGEKIPPLLLTRATSNLKLTTEEAQVIIPKILAILSYQLSASQELQPLRDNLREILYSGKASEITIRQQLDKIKTKTAEIKKKLQTMDLELITVLTFQQEARLTLNGVIYNGIGFSVSTRSQSYRESRRSDNRLGQNNRQRRNN